MQHPEKDTMESSRPHTSWKPSLDVHIEPQPGITGDNLAGHSVEPKPKQQPESKPEQSSWYRKPDPHQRRLPDLEDQQGLPRDPTDLGLDEGVFKERKGPSCCCSLATIFIVMFFVIVVVAAVVAGGVAGSQVWRRLVAKLTNMVVPFYIMMRILRIKLTSLG